jgi:hypothetical protein
MPASIFAKKSKAPQATGSNDLLVKQVRQSIADLNQIIGPLDAVRAEIAAKPLPALSPLVERLKAKGYSDAQTDDALMAATNKLRCSQCNAITSTACDCGTAYVRAGWRFFADKPELLKQINKKGANEHAVTENAFAVTKNGIGLRGRPKSGNAMTSAERVRKHRAKVAAESNDSAIDKLFPKGSPACDLDWEHDQEEGEPDSALRARAAKWQLLEAERLAVEFALLRDGAQSSEIKATVHIEAARKIARHWAKLAKELQRRYRPHLANSRRNP